MTIIMEDKKTNPINNDNSNYNINIVIIMIIIIEKI